MHLVYGMLDVSNKPDEKETLGNAVVKHTCKRLASS